MRVFSFFSAGAAVALAALGLASAQKLTEPAFSPVEMVVSANNLASDAGARILAMGGTVVDAMIAVQTVLGLVEPQSSGIAGGAFCVLYMDGNLTTFDAREKAPSGATETRFQDEDGVSLGFEDAWQSALAVGVPGIPRLMEDLHMMYGMVPWEELFQDAKTLALEGYEQTGRTVMNAEELFEMNPSCEERLFFRDDVAFEYFFDVDTCTPKEEGTIMFNPEYADTLDLMIAGGADAFYTGDVAMDIIDKVNADRNPTGDPLITLEDLGNYSIVERPAVCMTYRDAYDICGMGPPSSGELAVGQILGILNNFDLASNGDRQSTETVHLFTQAMRLAFADRNQYVGDPDFITVPVEGMLDPDYLAERATLIDPMMDMGTATYGEPPGVYDPTTPQIKTYEGGTSHISIVDQYGNALSMTTTVESYFGSGLMVRGFLLNNQITDFSFENTDGDGIPIANRVQPNKRPRSSMSPTMVFDSATGEVKYLAGSPGGFRIIGYTSQALVAMIDYGIDPQTAANTPHYQNQNGDTELETPIEGITSDYDIASLMSGLEALDHTVVERGGEESGLSLIEVTDDGYLGGADPRRDGTAVGRASLGDPVEGSPDEAASVVEESEDEGRM